MIGMILEEFDEELYKQNVREDGYLEGVEEGISRGQMQKAIESAENFLRKGIPVETISECIGLSLEQVGEIAQSISVKA